MNRSLSKVAQLLSVALFFAAGSALAEPGEHGDGPCKAIKAACESAGFYKGGHDKGKGLGMDCMKKIMEGGSVPGVSVTADQVAACKAKKAKWQEKRAAEGKEKK